MRILNRFLFRISGARQQEFLEMVNRVGSNAVLKTRHQVVSAVNLLRSFGLPLHSDFVKNWDSLAALAIIYRFFGENKNARILDAGGEKYSAILKQLRGVGFRDLTCINLVFKEAIVVKGIRFEYGDVTNTGFNDNEFDAIKCLSVLEHGVSPEKYFREMARILKPGGVLFTSVDFWDSPIDTRNHVAYGVPIKIFERAEILEMICLARKHGLLPMADLDLNCQDRVVSWKEFSLEYTFLYFCLNKP